MWKEYTKSLKFPESYISMGLGFLVVVVAGLLIFNYINRGKMTGGSQMSQNVESKTGPTAAAQPINPIPTIHTVSGGENLWTISEKYYHSGYNWVTIAKENNLSDPNIVTVGEKLTIPNAEPIVAGRSQAGMISNEAISISNDRITANTYTVKHGDDLWDIAVRAYGDGYKWIEISRINNLEYPNIIHSGNVLKLPR